MTAVLRKALADTRGRRLQTSVIAVVVALSSLAGALALSLLVETDRPFDHAFEQVSGAHLTVLFDPARATRGQVAATGSLAAVASSAGPFRELALPVDGAGGKQALSVQGRDRPDGQVDRLTLRAGQWVAQEVRTFAPSATTELGLTHFRPPPEPRRRPGSLRPTRPRRPRGPRRRGGRGGRGGPPPARQRWLR